MIAKWCREETYASPEALTSIKRLLPPTFGMRFWYIMRLRPLITRTTGPKIDRRMLTAPWFSPSRVLSLHGEITMASTNKPARGAAAPAQAPASQGLTAIGVGIDTAR